MFQFNPRRKDYIKTAAILNPWCTETKGKKEKVSGFERTNESKRRKPKGVSSIFC